MDYKRQATTYLYHNLMVISMLYRLRRVLIGLLLMAIFCPLYSAAQGSDTTKVRELNESAWKYKNSHPDSAYNFAAEALRIGTELDFKPGIEEAHSRIGVILKGQGLYKEALIHFHQCLSIRKNSGDSCYSAQAYQNIATTYREMGQSTRALEAMLEVLRIREANCDLKQQAKSLESIGNFYAAEGKVRRALSHHSRAYHVYHLDQDSGRISNALRNIANDYQLLKKVDSATIFYLEAIKIAKAIGWDDLLADCLMNFGVMSMETEQYQRAESNFLTSKSLFEQYGDQDAAGDALQNLGYLHEKKKNFDRAYRCFKLAIEKHALAGALDGELKSYAAIANLETVSGRTYFTPGQIERALMVSDTLNAIAKAEKMATLEALYQDRQKTDSLNLAQQKAIIAQTQSEFLLTEAKALSTQRNALLITAAALLLIALLVWLLLRSRLQTTRLRAEQREAETRENIANLIRQGEAQVFHAMFEGKEQERMRIASDLHDNLGSLLSTVKLYFSALESRLSDLPPDSRDHLTTATRLMDDAVGEVRRIAHDLVNGTLVKVGLVAALEEMARTIAQTGQTDVEVLSHGIRTRLDQETEIALFRVIQELLNNTLRHAAARHVTIQLNRINGLLSLMVEDDGRGFAPAKVRGRNGMGLESVRNRVKGLNGKVNFDSQPGRGTTVVIEIPISDQAA